MTRTPPRNPSKSPIFRQFPLASPLLPLPTSPRPPSEDAVHAHENRSDFHPKSGSPIHGNDRPPSGQSPAPSSRQRNTRRSRRRTPLSLLALAAPRSSRKFASAQNSRHPQQSNRDISSTDPTSSTRRLDRSLRRRHSRFPAPRFRRRPPILSPLVHADRRIPSLPPTRRNARRNQRLRRAAPLHLSQFASRTRFCLDARNRQSRRPPIPAAFLNIATHSRRSARRFSA